MIKIFPPRLEIVLNNAQPAAKFFYDFLSKLCDAANTAEKNAATLTSSIAALVPPGSLTAFAGTAAPSGWLLCNGASLVRTDYAKLFAAIGTTYGAADATHFTLPDARGRTLIGVGSGAGLTARALADVGGAETVQLTAAQSGLPAHTHNAASGSFVVSGGSSFSTTAGAGVTITGATGAVTGGALNAAQAHENMTPFLAVNVMIKT